MKEFIKVMKAMSDPNRVKLLKLLQKREMCVCEIQASLGIAQPTVSKHLKSLENAGLVKRKKDGLWVNYSLTDGAAAPMRRLSWEILSTGWKTTRRSGICSTGSKVSGGRICAVSKVDDPGMIF